MKKLLLSITIFFLPVFCFAAYTDQETIVIDHTKVPSTQTSFTVLATSTQAVMKTVGNSGKVQNANGYDIVYSSTPCIAPTLLNWENEKYVATTGERIDWILFTSLSSLVDTTFYRCFGNAAISTFQGGSTGSAWDSGFKGIWHLPNGTSLTANDSTSNGNNSTAIASEVSATTGQIDGGSSYAGITHNNNQITLANNSGLDVSGSDWTIESWLNVTDYPHNYNQPIQMNLNGMVIENPVSGGTYAVSILVNNAIHERTSFVSINAWHHFVMTRTGTTYNLYTDGVLDNAAAISDSGYGGTGGYTLGEYGFSQFQGFQDEARVSNNVRSANWIATEYNNQSNVATFMTIGNDTPVTSSIFNPWLLWEF